MAAHLHAWQICDTLEQKLDALFVHFAIEPWDYLNRSAEAAQLARGYNTAGRAEIEDARLHIHTEIADPLVPATRP